MRIAVYTGLFGRYDQLLDQPVAALSNADFICFTDDVELSSQTWEVRHAARALEQDPVRSARLYKILGDESLAEYDVTLYIDASVRLRRTPEEIIAEWLTDDHDLAVPAHSFREQLVDEFDEVIRLNRDDRGRVYEQLLDYSLAHPGELAVKPLWTGMLVRRSSSTVSAAMRTWADHVLRYSRRDQLSFPVALAQSGVRHRVIIVDNHDADSHEWPVVANRRVPVGMAPVLPPGPLVSELRRARLRIDDLEAEARGLQPERQRLADELAGLRAKIEQDAASVQRANDALRELGALEERWRHVSSVPGAARHLRRLIVGRVRRRPRAA